MDKEGIMIYLCMKGQNEWLEEVKAYFQKSSYVLKVIEIDDWQNELSLTNQKGKILLEKITSSSVQNNHPASRRDARQNSGKGFAAWSVCAFPRAGPRDCGTHART